jgi:hypothetical protein
MVTSLNILQPHVEAGENAMARSWSLGISPRSVASSLCFLKMRVRDNTGHGPYARAACAFPAAPKTAVPTASVLTGLDQDGCLYIVIKQQLWAG